MIFFPHSCCWLLCVARQHVPTQPHTVPLPAPSGAPSLPGRWGCSGASPVGWGRTSGGSTPQPSREMPLGWAGDATCRARLPGSRRAPGAHGSGSAGGGAPGTERPGFFPICSQPGTSPRRPPSIGHDKEPVSQKCLLSAASCQPVTGMISRSIRRHGFVARLRRRGAAAPGAACPKKPSKGWRQHDGHRRLDHGRWSWKAGKSREGQGRATGSCLCPRIGTCRNSNQRTKVVGGGRDGKFFFRSWLSRSWHFHNKLH